VEEEEEEEEEELNPPPDLFIFKDTIEGPRAPAVKPLAFAHLYQAAWDERSKVLWSASLFSTYLVTLIVQVLGL
jgi:hypothetical protein